MNIKWLIEEFNFKNGTNTIYMGAGLVEDELLMSKVVMDCLIQQCFMAPCSQSLE